MLSERLMDQYDVLLSRQGSAPFVFYTYAATPAVQRLVQRCEGKQKLLIVWYGKWQGNATRRLCGIDPRSKWVRLVPGGHKHDWMPKNSPSSATIEWCLDRVQKPTCCRFVKVWGEMRTGTNWITELLYRNIPQLITMQQMIQSKHTAAPFSPCLWLRALRRNTWKRHLAVRPVRLTDSMRNDLIASIVLSLLSHLVVWKDPYAWLWSLKKSAAKTQLVSSAEKQHRIELATRKYQHWSTLNNALHIRYEDALQNPQSVVAQVSDLVGLPCTTSFEPVLHIVTPRRVTATRFSSYGFYKDRKYLEELSADEIRLVTQYTDWDLFSQHGYKPVE